MSSGNAITPEVVAAPAATSTTVPVPVDPVAVFFTNFINQLMTGVAAPAIEAAAEAQVPFLALPIVKQLFEAIVNALAGKLSILEQQGALMIIFQIEQASTLYKLTASLKAIQDAHASGDQNAIDQAKQDAINQWASTIHFPGVAPVQS